MKKKTKKKMKKKTKKKNSGCNQYYYLNQPFLKKMFTIKLTIILFTYLYIIRYTVT